MVPTNILTIEQPNTLRRKILTINWAIAIIYIIGLYVLLIFLTYNVTSKSIAKAPATDLYLNYNFFILFTIYAWLKKVHEN